MSINIGDNFSYLGRKFLDSRQSFDTLELMNSCSDVPMGFITFCKEDNKRYEYTNEGWIEYTSSITQEQAEKINIAYLHSQSEHLQPEDLEGLASEEFVTNKIAEAQLGGEGSNVDLSGYVSKEELEAKGYLTGIPEEYVTDEELNAKGYLTEHQDLSNYATKEYVDEAVSNIDISGGDNVDIDLSDYVTNDKLQEGLANKFDDVEVNEVESNDNQTALDFYANGEVVKTVYFSGGGGGNAAIPPYISTILPENSILGLGEIFNLQLDFSSSVTGRGTVKIFVNDVESISMSIPQGENTIPMADTYFTKGNNRVTVYVIDRTGQMSNSLTFYVRYGSLEIASDFDAYTAYEPGAVVRYYFTPTAVDTSLALTMYMKIDGEVKDGVTCSSDTRGYFTFPNNLEVGAHFCQAYVMDSAGSTSNVLSFNFIVLDAVSLVVASDTVNPVVEEGEQLSIDYKVYMRGATSFITKTYIDENLVNTGTCGLDFAYYRTSALTEGIHTIKMEVYDVTETVSDYIIWTVTVTPSTYAMLQPVKAGSLFIGTAQNMTNSSENKEVWRGTDQDGAIVDGILHNFAFNSESGWVDDELLITGASSVEIPITPLANNARYGFTLDIEFASKMIGVDDALVLNLWDDEKDCGIKITTEQVILRSAEGNQADLYFTDSQMTSVIFVIDRNETTAKIYLNGVMCSAFHLSDYSIDGVPYLEDFTVNNTILLGGSGHARIKNLRVYQVALSTDEILNNFMANETRKAEQKALVEFQKGDHLPTLTIYCDFSGLGKDDKKPCAITYVSTDEEKYGKSFTLTHKKSTCQYQGTSSMAYPIKNYRINLADEEGNKWKYDFPYGKPERRYTLKADFMSSGHWTNTGLTKWINNNLYNYDLDDEKSMNPKKWYDINNGGSIDDTRECIYGFPCRLILVNDGNTSLNEGQNEPTPGNTKDMGIFNFNHDKDATDTMGFDTDVFPNCASYEVTANSDTSAGAFMRNFKKMEFSEANRYGGYYQLTTLGLKLGDTVTYKTSGEAIATVLYYNSSNVVVSTENLGKNEGTFVIPEDENIAKIRFRISSTEIDWVMLNGEQYQVTIVDGSPSSSVGESDLDYIKQSFELRFPDEDDVPEGWGFMGLPNNKINYMTESNFYIFDKIKATNKTIKIITNTTGAFRLSTYNSSSTWVRNITGLSSGGSVTLNANEEYYAIGIPTSSTLPKTLTINDISCEVGKKVEFIGNYTPGELVITSDGGVGLKALIDWVDGCTDEEFVRDFDQHFNRDYTLRYFLLVITLGMVDNLGKNMMLDTWDNKIFMPRFYDCDTICSYDNSGQLKFDVDIEMAQGYWNTSSSRLWTRIRDLMHDELVAKYNNMRQNGLSYESLMECFYDEQIAKIPQRYYNMDYDVKYGPFADSYIGMANGDTYEHLKRWLQQRLRFVDTLYDYAPSYNNDVLTIRANTTEPMTLEIETYTPVYQHLSWYNNQMDKKKIDGKTSVSFTGTAMAATDQEVLIYGGSNIKSIKGISSMNPNRMLIGSATKLVTLEAPNCPLLADINANKANLAPHIYLNKVDLSGCPLLGGNLIVNQSPLVREIDIRGTAITGLNLPPSLRNLEVLKLPAAIPNLVLNDAGQLHTLEFEEGVKLQSVSMTNCNALVNTTNFNLEDATSITLNNSYNSIDELYFSKATNLSLSNMSNLERVIYTPNAEHEAFDKTNVDNASNYTVSTFNCPKLNEFITTAPYRNSYNKDYGEKKPNEVFEANILDISSTQFRDVKLLCTTDTNKLLLPRTINNLVIDSAYDLDTELLTDGDYNTIHTDLYEAYNTDYEESVKINDETPDIIPSASDGSLIFSMYAPHNTTEPASGTWDLKGLQIDTLHTFGLNNDVKQSDGMILEGKNLDWSFSWGTLDITTILNDGFTSITPLSGSNHTISCYDKDDTNVARYTAAKVNTEYSIPENTYRIDIECYSSEVEKVSYKVAMLQIQMPNRTDDYTYKIDNLTLSDEVMRYTATTTNAFPTFNDDFEYYYIVEPKEGEYLYRIVAENDTLLTTIKCTNDTIKKMITSVEYLDTKNITTMYYAFNGCSNLRFVNTAEWNLDNVTSMENMFNACTNLTDLDFSGLGMPNVTTMVYFCGNSGVKTVNLDSVDAPLLDTLRNAFYGCTAITSVSLRNVNMPNLTDMSRICNGVKTLVTIDFTDSTFGNVTTLNEAFYACRALESVLGLGNVITSSTKELSSTFYSCSALDTVDLSGCDTSGVTTMSNMFSGCSVLTSLDVSNFKTSNVRSINGMFNNCTKLESLDVSGWDTSSVTTMGSMFTSCKGLTSLDLSNFNTSNVTSMGSIFQACSNLISLDLSNWDTSKVTNVERMFAYCSSLQELIIYNWPLTTTNQTAINTLPDGNDAKNDIYATVYFTVPSGWSIISPLDFLIYTTNASGVEPTFNNEFTGYSVNETDNGDGTYRVKIATDDLSNLPTSISFSGKANLLTVEKINTSNVTNMSSMFYGCSALTSLDVTNFDTSKVTDMGHMFRECKNLTSLDVSNFDTSNVTNMTYMFQYCSMLTSLDLSNFNTSKVTNMSYMFSRCSALTSLDVSNFDTSNVTTMIYMFYRCSALTSLDLSNFDISNVIYMGSMFDTCYALMSLNVIGWPLTDVTQTAITSLPTGDDAKNEIYATVAFTVPSGWSLINNASMTMSLRQTDLDNLTDEEIAALVDEGWTIG